MFWNKYLDQMNSGLIHKIWELEVVNAKTLSFFDSEDYNFE